MSPRCTPVPRTPVPTPPAPLWLLFQVVVEGPTSSMELHSLTAGTEYLVSVFPVREAGVGESLRGLVTTGGRGGAGRGFPGCLTQSLPLEPPTSKGVQRPPGSQPTCCVTKAQWLGLSDPQCPLLSCSHLLWSSCPLWPATSPL